MTDLIQRLQDASEGSRELDAAIAVAMRNGLPRGSEWALKFPKWEVQPGNKGVVRIIGNVNGNCDDISGRFTAPAYSTSIDAAMTLVPEGWVITDVSQRLPCNQNWEWAAVLGKLVDGEWELANGCSKTAPGSFALALCIAALRARDTGHE
jgi:hypothetical protein